MKMTSSTSINYTLKKYKPFCLYDNSVNYRKIFIPVMERSSIRIFSYQKTAFDTLHMGHARLLKGSIKS
ncbi:unnamed protein product [Rotaria sordida]|uniref:Uncharacterized protein n=1 Tax=Rotaria sordida TaxID=392033 RepID=A0A815DEV1_9BILA|nr:unnamed protein product [Rotaria sordida]CAF1571225.1 unnamed protein product [Rotaria sordida]